MCGGVSGVLHLFRESRTARTAAARLNGLGRCHLALWPPLHLRVAGISQSVAQ